MRHHSRFEAINSDGVTVEESSGEVEVGVTPCGHLAFSIDPPDSIKQAMDVEGAALHVEGRIEDEPRRRGVWAGWRPGEQN